MCISLMGNLNVTIAWTQIYQDFLNSSESFYFICSLYTDGVKPLKSMAFNLITKQTEIEVSLYTLIDTKQDSQTVLGGFMQIIGQRLHLDLIS